MANVKGVNKTLIDAGGMSLMARGMIDGRVKVMLDTYALTTGNLAGDVIKLGGALPVGANVIAIILAVTAAQASLTFKLGDANTTNRYASTGHTGLQTAKTPVILGGANYVVTAAGTDDQIQLTTEAATATAATLSAAIIYSND